MNEHIWQEILKEGERLNLPVDDKRGILREFLQTKILGYLYDERKTEKLQFMGGTALRLVYGLPRFSEDLDFDNLGLDSKELETIIKQVSKKMEKEGLKNEVIFKKTNKRAIFVFKDLLFDLKISGHKEEKLKINFDYIFKRKPILYQVFFLSRFDVNQRIVVNAPQTILAEKMQALLSRKRVIPRDIFDIAWLLTKNFLPAQKKDKILVKKMLGRVNKVKVGQIKKELKPFLFHEEDLKLLAYFPDLIRKLL